MLLVDGGWLNAASGHSDNKIDVIQQVSLLYNKWKEFFFSVKRG